jgi:hypothetical protein
VSPDYRAALLVTAAALPAGSAVPVPREWLLELLSSSPAPAPPDVLTERMLTAEEVAELLNIPKTEKGKAPRWVYNHADQLGGKRLSRRCLRFPESAVRRYLERRR